MVGIRKIVFLFACFFMGGVFSVSAESNDPLNKLQIAVSEVLEILYSEESALDAEAKERAILNALGQHYDLNVIIRRSIGRNSQKIDPTHQDETLALIKQLVVRAYVDGMKAVSKPKVAFSNTSYRSPKRAEVATEVVLGGQSVRLVYRFGLMNSGWQIYDILIENISLVVTYRSQFDAFFIKHQSDTLLTKLKELLTNENLGQSLPL